MGWRCISVAAAFWDRTEKGGNPVRRASKRIRRACGLGLALAVAAPSPQAQALAQSSRFEALAELPFVEGRPTEATAKALRDELLFERAVQAYLWAMPLINTLGMKDGSEQCFGQGYNVLPIWKKRLDAKTLITTPNSDVLYAMGYVDLGRDGPLVLDAPPRMQGILLDVWQRPIPMDGGLFFGDVGLAGPDGGAGGKFLLLPPGYAGEVPPGYFVCRPATNTVFVFLRAFYQNPNDLAPAAALLEKTRLYPLDGAATAKPMQFPDASGVAVDMLPRRDASVFDQLKYLVDREGSNLAEADWRGLLAAIGLVAGQPFAPDAGTRVILDQAARTAYKMSRVVGFAESVSGRCLRLYPDRCWVNPMGDGAAVDLSDLATGSASDAGGGFLDLDLRLWYFTNYYSVSPGMVSKTPGKGAKYMVAFSDGNGAPLSGEGHYGLTLPADVPAANFWSVTLYEAANGSGLANGQPFPSLGSRDGLLQNADGSTDLFFGPQAPAATTGNWIATVPGKGWFAVLRLYGPTETALNGTWKPGDIKRLP